ncbi:MAG: hypothetical protein ACK4TP_07180 [Hyphomicrobium sp.]|jgi:hypothetical protein
MRRPAAIAMLMLPLASAPALAERIVQLALPTQQPEGPPPRPVGDPDTPPISLDLFDTGSSQEESWPWPPLSTEE